MKWTRELLANLLVFAGTMMIALHAAADDWLDRRREARLQFRADDMGSLKEERWWEHRLK